MCCVQSDRKMINTKLFRGFGCVRRKQEHWGLPLTGRLVNTATGSEHCVKGRFYAGNIFQARGQLAMNGCERCFVYPSVQKDMVCVTSGILPHVQEHSTIQYKVALKYVTKTIKESFPGTKPREVELLEMVSKPPRCEYVVELLEWLDNNLLSEHEVREIMWQVLLAASHCTDRNVFHGDLQSKNFLLNTDTMKVKLIDFGCGYLVSDFYTSGTGHITSLWSLGLLMVELICGTINFDSTDQMINRCSQLVSAECIKLDTVQFLRLRLQNKQNPENKKHKNKMRPPVAHFKSFQKALLASAEVLSHSSEPWCNHGPSTVLFLTSC
ncbi:hypothetical protein Q7C36_002842 [Tachysurus vachellii]|uniref:non-specific serine/threonine protein kinase n=1 Tax=Tachysurus vachellii TaxID=175792 RepID=A0AA88NV50_TACVA|nr:hypothetical protein Q7C36_002842 [Tachysurus vachellii]